MNRGACLQAASTSRPIVCLFSFHSTFLFSLLQITYYATLDVTTEHSFNVVVVGLSLFVQASEEKPRKDSSRAEPSQGKARQGKGKVVTFCHNNNNNNNNKNDKTFTPNHNNQRST